MRKRKEEVDPAQSERVDAKPFGLVTVREAIDWILKDVGHDEANAVRHIHGLIGDECGWSTVVTRLMDLHELMDNAMVEHLDYGLLCSSPDDQRLQYVLSRPDLDVNVETVARQIIATLFSFACSSTHVGEMFGECTDILGTVLVRLVRCYVSETQDAGTGGSGA